MSASSTGSMLHRALTENGQRISSEVPAIFGQSKRKALGIYYTPPDAARLLASWAIRSHTDVVLEPSFGGCALLAAAIDVFHTLGVADPSSRLIGYDVDPTAFEHLSTLGVSSKAKNFFHQDFLLSKPLSNGVSAVLANPPFVSYHRMNTSQRRVVRDWRSRYGSAVNQRASLWAYFVLHAMHHLAEGGRMACVTASAMQTADYARPLLLKLRSHFSSVRVLNVRERLFTQSGADERVSLIFADQYSRQPRGVLGALNNHQFESLEGFSFDVDSRNVESRDADAFGLADSALQSCRPSTVDLGARCQVSIGEVVGATKFFVRSEKDWRRAAIPKSNLVPMLTRSTQVDGLRIQQSDLACRIPLLLRPPEAIRSSRVRALLEYWTPSRIRANSTLRRRPNWFRCSYNTNADAFIASLSHIYPRLIGNAARISCANGFYKIQVTSWPELAPWLPLIALTSPFRISAELFGRAKGAGALKLEPSDVRKLVIPATLPNIDERTLATQLQTVEKLVAGGDLPTAMRLADEMLYEQPELLDQSRLLHLRALCDELVRQRLTPHSQL